MHVVPVARCVLVACLSCPSSNVYAYAIVACKQNGICCASYPHTDWDYRFDAGRTESTSGRSHLGLENSGLIHDQNRRRAFQVLRARLMDLKIMQDQAERRATRKSLVQTADRSEKIRTYNYPQVRPRRSKCFSVFTHETEPRDRPPAWKGVHAILRGNDGGGWTRESD